MMVAALAVEPARDMPSVAHAGKPPAIALLVGLDGAAGWGLGPGTLWLYGVELRGLQGDGRWHQVRAC